MKICNISKTMAGAIDYSIIQEINTNVKCETQVFPRQGDKSSNISSIIQAFVGATAP